MSLLHLFVQYFVSCASLRSDDERAFNEIAFFAVLSNCSNYQVVCAFQITERKLLIVNHARGSSELLIWGPINPPTRLQPQKERNA